MNSISMASGNNTNIDKYSNNINTFSHSTLFILISIYTLIILFGTIGNSWVLYIFLTNIKLRNVRNAFMANLAISNLLLITVCTPSHLINFIQNNNWIFGSFWCKFLNSLQIVIILVSAFSIMMISIDRCLFIVFVRGKQLSTRHTAIIIALIWVVSCLLALPTFIQRYVVDTSNTLKLIELHYSNFSFYSNGTMSNASLTLLNNAQKMKLSPITYCFEDDWYLKREYIVTLFTLEFVIPCVCMLVTYVWIIVFLKKQHTRMSHYELLRRRLIQKDKPHQKSCKLLSALCITFIFCWLPLSIFNTLIEFQLDVVLQIDSYDFYLIFTVLTTIAAVNAMINPLLYGWMNQNFRNEIIKQYQSMTTKKVLTKAVSSTGAATIVAQSPSKIYRSASHLTNNNHENHNKKSILSENGECIKFMTDEVIMEKDLNIKKFSK